MARGKATDKGKAPKAPAKVSKSKARRTASLKKAPKGAPAKVKKPEVAKALPVFEGLQVVRILGSKHTKTHLHCELLDGSTKVTKHVPKELFK